MKLSSEIFQIFLILIYINAYMNKRTQKVILLQVIFIKLKKYIHNIYIS